MNRFVHCTHCDEGFMETPFDQCPEYEFDPAHPSELFRSKERNDFQEFLKNHRGHRLEYLKIVEGSFVSEKAYIEPVKISYFRATNKKQEKFVVKRSREKIGEPVKYQVIPGDYFLEYLGVEIQSEEIARQLDAEFQRDPLAQPQISAFLKLYGRIVRSIDIKSLERIPQESSHPLEIYYSMDDKSVVYLLRHCRAIFEERKYSDIVDFVYRHKDAGVLLLKAKYKIKIKERAKTKKEVASPADVAAVKKVK